MGETQPTNEGNVIPLVASYKPLRAKIRERLDPRNTPFNTDGQAFSGIGVSIVIFMENCDIVAAGTMTSTIT